MNIPITFKVSRDTGGIENWIINSDMIGRVSYDWETSLISFEDNEDAVAFSLAFKAHRFETLIERMIKDA